MRQTDPARAFGPLLRAFRTDAGLTQEQLAERCGLSRRGIADLERGARQTPQAHTVERLVAGLGLSQDQRNELLRAVRQTRHTHGLVPLAPPPESPRREFVGRDVELGALRAAAERALDGNNGVCAFVAGEPGIGKTALCEQFATYASSQGMRALVGRCYEDASLSPPYAPFLDALRSYVRALPTDELRSQLGSNAAEVARLLPELSDRLRMQASESGRGQDERWRLLSALADFLRSAAGACPIVLVLEDLHWADLATLDLLRYLMRHLAGARLLIIATYRDAELERDHALRNLLAESWRRSDCLRIELVGLTNDEVQLLSHHVADHSISDAVAALLQRLTEGNPLFVEEIVRYMLDAGMSFRLQQAAPDTALLPQLPVGVREMIGARLGRLSGACHEVLAVASVLGRDFEWDTVRQVADLPDADLLTAVEEAQRARIVEDISHDRYPRFRFAHALFRETLYLDLFTPRRLMLHQRVAQVLESRYANDIEEHAAELTEHFQRSGDPRDVDKALRYAEIAANRALQVCAYGEAARHLRTALALQPAVNPSALEKRCDLWLALGNAMVGAGELEGVPTDVAGEALRLADSLDDDVRAFQACLLAGEALAARSGINSSGTPEFKYWVEELQRRAGVDPTRQSLALGGRAGALCAAGDERAARASSRQAVDLARQVRDRSLFHIVARVDIEPWMWSATEQSQRLVLAQDLLDSINQTLVGHGSGGHYYNTIHFVQFAVGDVLLTWGQRQQAETLWTSDLKERLEYPWSGLVAGRVQFILDCLDGKLEQALDLAGAHIQTAELLGATPFGRENAAVYLRRTQLYLGRADEALAGFHAEFETLAPGELPVAGLFGMYAAQRAVCLAHAGRHTDAQAVLDHFLSMRDPLDASDELPMPSAVALLEVATSVGDRSAAAVLTEALQVAADLVAVDGTLTVIARHLAAACALDDHWDRARTYATQAMRIAEKVGFRPEAALARLQLAQLELEEGNLPEVRRLLDQTTPELVAMHMQPALEDAIALRSKSAATIR